MDVLPEPGAGRDGAGALPRGWVRASGRIPSSPARPQEAGAQEGVRVGPGGQSPCVHRPSARPGGSAATLKGVALKDFLYNEMKDAKKPVPQAGQNLATIRKRLGGLVSKKGPLPLLQAQVQAGQTPSEEEVVNAVQEVSALKGMLEDILMEVRAKM